MLILAIVLLDIFVWLLASVPLWQLDLNSISSINLIMAIGLVVDYSLHINYSFILQEEKLGSHERVLRALKEVGPAVLLGLITTFIGVLPLGFASSAAFRVFFKMFLAIVVSGLLHGFLLLPVLLAMFPPRSLSDFQKNQKNPPEEKKNEIVITVGSV